MVEMLIRYFSVIVCVHYYIPDDKPWTRSAPKHVKERYANIIWRICHCGLICLTVSKEYGNEFKHFSHIHHRSDRGAVFVDNFFHAFDTTPKVLHVLCWILYVFLFDFCRHHVRITWRTTFKQKYQEVWFFLWWNIERWLFKDLFHRSNFDFSYVFTNWARYWFPCWCFFYYRFGWF